MKLHKEGYSSIMLAGIFFLVIETVLIYFKIYETHLFVFLILSILPTFILIAIMQFFRIPIRKYNYTEGNILCPADGEIVVIEEVEETEYFYDKRIQISIFMSPLNVHANFNPVSGVIQYMKYHKGLNLVAWHPKSSTDNERTTFVIKTEAGQEVLLRQVAGALARRICYYLKEGQRVNGGEEFGFIKFGSRVDVFLPLNTKIKVHLNQKVKAQLTEIAQF
ncbi:MAG: phosphatidylserine decarboxylase family protein [Bacteroidetes bacterium]|nr:phosphatidylserine decarboxylase family protein [Bacteroidota bacterium]